MAIKYCSHIIGEKIFERDWFPRLTNKSPWLNSNLPNISNCIKYGLKTLLEVFTLHYCLHQYFKHKALKHFLNVGKLFVLQKNSKQSVFEELLKSL